MLRRGIGRIGSTRPRVALCRLSQPLTIHRLHSTQKPIFYDMLHSNNAARIRLWIDLSSAENSVERRVIEYPDLGVESRAG